MNITSINPRLKNCCVNFPRVAITYSFHIKHHERPMYFLPCLSWGLNVYWAYLQKYMWLKGNCILERPRVWVKTPDTAPPDLPAQLSGSYTEHSPLEISYCLYNLGELPCKSCNIMSFLLSFYLCEKQHYQKQLWGAKELYDLYFHSIISGSHSRNLNRNLMQNPWKNIDCWITHRFMLSSLHSSGPHVQGMVSPIVV